jgi:hypothetical protein
MNRLSHTFNLYLSAILTRKFIAQLLPCRIRNLNSASQAARLHATRNDYCVAPQIVDELVLANDAGDDRTAIDPGPHLQVIAIPSVKVCQYLKHIQSGVCSPCRVSSHGLGNARNRHVAIANGFDLLEAAGIGDGIELRKNFIEKKHKLPRRRGGREFGETDYVSE